jgi:hypothetical protein
MIPNSSPDQRTPILAVMLKDAAINAQPMKYTQNIRHGMYGGTMSLTNAGPKRCSAPKTASGIPKHKLLKATILSRPRASAIWFFAAHTPIKKSAMPAEHIATAVPEISKNVARVIGYIVGVNVTYFDRRGPTGKQKQLLLSGSGLQALQVQQRRGDQRFAKR